MSPTARIRMEVLSILLKNTVLFVAHHASRSCVQRDIAKAACWRPHTRLPYTGEGCCCQRPMRHNQGGMDEKAKGAETESLRWEWACHADWSQPQWRRPKTPLPGHVHAAERPAATPHRHLEKETLEWGVRQATAYHEDRFPGLFKKVRRGWRKAKLESFTWGQNKALHTGPWRLPNQTRILLFEPLIY